MRRLRANLPISAAAAVLVDASPFRASALADDDSSAAPSAMRHNTLDRLLSRTSNSHTPHQDDHRNAASDNDNTHSLDDMVPITFQLLTEHYAQFPSPSIDPALETLRQETATLRTHILDLSSCPPDTAAAVGSILHEDLPHGLDNSMYSLRCACEEAAHRLRKIPQLAPLQPRLLAVSKTFETFQEHQSAHVQLVVNEFLPRDFRSNLFTFARQQSERSNAAAVKDLMDSGASVRDKYKLLWEQQWKRRETLASVGNATGIWKALVKYLAGVPEPLLRFVKDINAPKGPTEALRVKFGASLTKLVHFAFELNALCAVVESAPTHYDKVLPQLTRDLDLYQKETETFVQLLELVITNSPFFVKPDQIAALWVDQHTNS